MKSSNKQKRLMAVLLCAFLALFSSGCSIAGWIGNLFKTAEEKSLNAGRPEGATALPDFSGEITDIRVSVVPRDLEVDPAYDGFFAAEAFKSKTLLQIYYGYLSDGTWYDMPRENYDLREIFAIHGDVGYDAAEDNHIAKIGPYLLMCYAYAPFYNVTYDINKLVFDISDTLGTEVQEPFAEYYTPYSTDADLPGYGYLKEDRESIIKGDLEFEGSASFDKFFFLIVKLDTLPEDYKIHVLVYPEYDTEDILFDETLTMDEIREILDLD